MIQLVALNFQLLPEQIQVEAHLAVRLRWATDHPTSAINDANKSRAAPPPQLLWRRTTCRGAATPNCRFSFFT